MEDKRNINFHKGKNFLFKENSVVKDGIAFFLLVEYPPTCDRGHNAVIRAG